MSYTATLTGDDAGEATALTALQAFAADTVNGVTAATFTDAAGTVTDLVPVAPPVDPYAELDKAAADLDDALAAIHGGADVTLTADQAKAITDAAAALDAAIAKLDPGAVLPSIPAASADGAPAEPAHQLADGTNVAL